MIKEHRRTFKILRLIFDLVVVSAVYYLLYGITLWGANPLGLVLTHADYQWRLAVILALCWCFSFLATGTYENTRQVNLSRALMIAAKTLAVMLLVFTLGLFFLKIQYLSRKFMLAYSLGCLVLLALSKAGEFSLMRVMRRMGFNTLSVVLIGEGPEVDGALALFQRHEEWGYRLAGCLGLSKPFKSRPGLRSLGSLKNLAAILRTRIVDEIIFAAPLGRSAALRNVLSAAAVAGVSVRLMLDPDLNPWKPQIDKLGEMPLMVLQVNRRNPYSQILKSVADWAVAALFVALFSWLFLLVSAAIWVTMGRPIFFRQKRAGRNGRVFFLYKFRTMIPNARDLQDGLAHANQMQGPVFKIQNDPRVTPLGRFLRRSSLDELPQFLNVLRGELSLVGPRPLAKYEARRVPQWAWRRYSVKPGITCLWQVMGRNKLTFKRWMELDLAYIDHWSPWLDLKIILRTFPAVFFSKGAY